MPPAQPLPPEPPPPSQPVITTPGTVSSPLVPAAKAGIKKSQRWLIEIGVIALVLIIGTAAALGIYFVQHHWLMAADHATSSTSSHTSAKRPTHASAPSPVAPAAATASPPPVAAAPAPPPAPPTISLASQDNGRTITIALGTILHVYLPGVAGYHWAIEARSNNPRLFGPSGPVVQGSDGSITESNIALLSGQVVRAYTDEPDCYPGSCPDIPRATWSVNVTVQ